MVGPYPAAGGSGVSCVILRNIVSSSHASVEQSVIDRDHDSSTRRGVRGGTYSMEFRIYRPTVYAML